MIGIQLVPTDTLFFRDGTPFSAGDPPQPGVGRLFPPHPTSVAGAIRATLARCNGWDGQGRWPASLNAILGDGPEDLGKLAFDGPFLLRNDQPLFPAPRHMVGSTVAAEWTPRAFLRPGSGVTCDLGDGVRLPRAPSAEDVLEDRRPADDHWLTQDGMQAALRGVLPTSAEIVSARALWREELRIGLERDGGTRTAREGMLYTTRHVRPLRAISLCVRITGIPGEWKIPVNGLARLGGESRFVELRTWSGDVTIDMPWTRIEASKKVMVMALTPLDLDKAVYPGNQLDVSSDTRIISACLAGSQRIGGWNSLNRSPLPLRRVLPSGSALFCEVGDPATLRTSVKANGGLMRVGLHQAWGFGRAALGIWPDESEVNS